MNTGRVVGVVVAAHVIVVGAIMLPGCGRTVKPVSATPTPAKPVVPGVEQPPKLPPPLPPPVAVASRPVKEEPVLPTPQVKIHVVGKGESLSKIAKKYGVRTTDLVALNGIKDPNRVREGQELKIPLAGVGATVAPSVTPSAKEPVAAEVTYVVVKGDILSRIAVRHGTTTKAIKELNGMKSDTIRVGQKLRMPAGKIPAAPAPSMPAASTPAPAGLTATPASPVRTEPARPAPAPAVAKPAPAVGTLPPAPPVAPKPSADAKASVPAVSVSPAPAGNAVAKPVASEAVPLLIHEVRADEDLVGIAMMYGVSVDAVKKANGLVGDSVKPGQKLKIP